MGLTAGQVLAIDQLREVAAAAERMGSVMSLVNVEEPDTTGKSVWAEISITCADLPRAPEGLPLKERQHLKIRIPPDFPFQYPAAWVTHNRFAGFPHVHWKHWLCLYQAPSVEWDPSDGMYGFLDRLDYWLRQGALGQLDPMGGPLHPPITYLADGPVRIVVPRVNAPAVTHEPWIGHAVLQKISDRRVDLVRWLPSDGAENGQFIAASILLPAPFPYEFPTNVQELITSLAERGVTHERFLQTLRSAAARNGQDAPLHVVIGTPMRGARGGVLRQHLTAWYIEPPYAWGLSAAYDQFSDDPETRAFGDKIEKLVKNWAQHTKVDWCFVMEDRPEIVIRRDRETSLSWFQGRTVALWGCGAIGGHVAEYLTRAGVKKLILIDNGFVTPGVLVRQPYDDSDIGYAKAPMLRDRLCRIRSDLEVDVSVGSLLEEPLGESDWAKDAEVVVDCAASVSVLELLERLRWKWEGRKIPIVSMALGRTAQRGMVVLSYADHSGGPQDLIRRMKLEACNRPDLGAFEDEFWPTDRRSFFQPEPGCSDATFVGSAADVAGLSAIMLNCAAVDLRERVDGYTATGHFIKQPHTRNSLDQAATADFAWKPDRISHDEHAGYEIRISPQAWSSIRSWISDGTQRFGANAETGGLLLGERDEAAGVIWITEVSGPPSDSEHSPERFICGTQGTAELNKEKLAQSRGSVKYLGMWHTHPDSLPVPSLTDWDAMRRLVQTAGGSAKSLMLIVGMPLGDWPVLGTYVFRAADFSTVSENVVFRPCVMRVLDWN